MRTFHLFWKPEIDVSNCLEHYCQARILRSLGLLDREERSLAPKVFEKSIEAHQEAT